MTKRKKTIRPEMRDYFEREAERIANGLSEMLDAIDPYHMELVSKGYSDKEIEEMLIKKATELGYLPPRPSVH